MSDACAASEQDKAHPLNLSVLLRLSITSRQKEGLTSLIDVMSLAQEICLIIAASHILSEWQLKSPAETISRDLSKTF